MTQRLIRTAVAGTNHGLSHVLEVLRNPRFELIAICDRNEKKLAQIRGEHVDHSDEQPWFAAHRASLLEQARAYPQLQRARLVTDFDRLLAMADVDPALTPLPLPLNPHPPSPPFRPPLPPYPSTP